MIKSVMNVEEIANYLGFSSKKIYRLAESKRIPASRIGRQYRFVKVIIDNWLCETTVLEKVGWGQRLDLVLKRMRSNASKEKISEKDITREIKKVRAQKHENT